MTGTYLARTESLCRPPKNMLLRLAIMQLAHTNFFYRSLYIKIKIKININININKFFEGVYLEVFTS